MKMSLAYAALMMVVSVPAWAGNSTSPEAVIASCTNAANDQGYHVEIIRKLDNRGILFARIFEVNIRGTQIIDRVELGAPSRLLDGLVYQDVVSNGKIFEMYVALNNANPSYFKLLSNLGIIRAAVKCTLSNTVK